MHICHPYRWPHGSCLDRQLERFLSLQVCRLYSATLVLVLYLPVNVCWLFILTHVSNWYTWSWDQVYLLGSGDWLLVKEICHFSSYLNFIFSYKYENLSIFLAVRLGSNITIFPMPRNSYNDRNDRLLTKFVNQ